MQQLIIVIQKRDKIEISKELMQYLANNVKIGIMTMRKAVKYLIFVTLCLFFIGLIVLLI